jgi:hypothetical protein
MWAACPVLVSRRVLRAQASAQQGSAACQSSMTQIQQARCSFENAVLPRNTGARLHSGG